MLWSEYYSTLDEVVVSWAICALNTLHGTSTCSGFETDVSLIKSLIKRHFSSSFKRFHFSYIFLGLFFFSAKNVSIFPCVLWVAELGDQIPPELNRLELRVSSLCRVGSSAAQRHAVSSISISVFPITCEPVYMNTLINWRPIQGGPQPWPGYSKILL